MKMYVISLSAGVLVGIVYSLLNVRSPAPPLVALVGPSGSGVNLTIDRDAVSERDLRSADRRIASPKRRQSHSS